MNSNGNYSNEVLDVFEDAEDNAPALHDDIEQQPLNLVDDSVESHDGDDKNKIITGNLFDQVNATIADLSPPAKSPAESPAKSRPWSPGDHFHPAVENFPIKSEDMDDEGAWVGSWRDSSSDNDLPTPPANAIPVARNVAVALKTEEDEDTPKPKPRQREPRVPRERVPRQPWPCLDLSDKAVRKRWFIATVIFIIVVTALIGASLKKVSSVQYGVNYDIYRKNLDSFARQGGLFWGAIGYHFIKFPSTQISTELQDTCVSRDGLRVEFEVVYQYQLKPEWIVDVILEYRDYDKWSQVVHAAGNSAIQHSCSFWNVTDFQSKRLAVQNTMFTNLQLKLEGESESDSDVGVYARASSLQLIFVGMPTEYKDAVTEKQGAEEDIALAKNERIQEKTKANTELLAAQKQAQMIMDSAYNEGNITMTLANLKAQQTLYMFGKETQALTQAQEFMVLDTNGVLSYMANKLYAKVPYLSATLGEPARISRKNLLSNLVQA